MACFICGGGALDTTGFWAIGEAGGDIRELSYVAFNISNEETGFLNVLGTGMSLFSLSADGATGMENLKAGAAGLLCEECLEEVDPDLEIALKELFPATSCLDALDAASCSWNDLYMATGLSCPPYSSDFGGVFFFIGDSRFEGTACSLQLAEDCLLSGLWEPGETLCGWLWLDRLCNSANRLMTPADPGPEDGAGAADGVVLLAFVRDCDLGCCSS